MKQTPRCRSFKSCINLIILLLVTTVVSTLTAVFGIFFSIDLLPEYWDIPHGICDHFLINSFIFAGEIEGSEQPYTVQFLPPQAIVTQRDMATSTNYVVYKPKGVVQSESLTFHRDGIQISIEKAISKGDRTYFWLNIQTHGNDEIQLCLPDCTFTQTESGEVVKPLKVGALGIFVNQEFRNLHPEQTVQPLVADDFTAVDELMYDYTNVIKRFSDISVAQFMKRPAVFVFARQNGPGIFRVLLRDNGDAQNVIDLRILFDHVKARNYRDMMDTSKEGEKLVSPNALILQHQG